MSGGPLEAGQTVAGRYRVEKVLGAGGMGAVYEAEHLELRKRVALKVLLPALATDGEAVARFMREARSAAAIGHPGIVEVFDLGREAELVFLVMEKLEGEELADRITRKHPLPIDFVVRVGVDLADAIASAHACGIIHRDLKPQNVFLARRGRSEDIVKVLDFGIAKLVETKDLAGVPLTHSGQVYGTPLYMAPEQLKSSKLLDARADVYAIGAILYQALTGRAPHSAESFPELVVKILMEPPTPIRELRPDTPDALVAIVEHAMAKSVDDRLESAAALRDALVALGDTASVQRTSGRVELDAIAVSKTLAATPVPVGLVATPFSSVTDRPPAPPSAPPPKRRSSVWLLAAGLGVFAVGALGVVMSGALSRTPTDVRPDAQPVAYPTEPRHAAGGGSAAVPAPDRMPEPPPTQPAPPSPETHSVRFESVPSGAMISVDGEPRCSTPCTQELPAVRARVTAHLPGYVDAERTIEPPWPDLVPLRLTRARRRVAPPGGDGPPPPLLLLR